MEQSKGFTVILRETQSKPAVRRAATIFTLTEDRPKPDDLLDALGVVGCRHYKKMPNKCSICKSTTMSTLEIVGLSEEPVFWECEDCGALFCKRTKEWICKNIVDKLYDCWTVPDVWEEVPDKEEYN
jgi:hypothetical protein